MEVSGMTRQEQNNDGTIEHQFLSPEEPLLDVDGLANELKVPRSWVYTQTRRKGDDTIPSVRVGKYVRFYKSHVLVWLHRTGGRRQADRGRECA